MEDKIEKILSIPKSFWVSWKLIGFREAFKLPIMVRYNVCCKSLRGSVITKSGVIHSMIQIGFGKVGVFDKRYQRSILQIDGTIVIDGVRNSVFLGHGSRLSIANNGVVDFGRNFNNTAMITIVCKDAITFGDNVTTSWNVLVMDTDWHSVRNMETDEIQEMTKPISIGSNVWLCTRCVVLKGSVIPNGCIIGANSLVSKHYEASNAMIAGNPGRIIKENVQFVNVREI